MVYFIFFFTWTSAVSGYINWVPKIAKRFLPRKFTQLVEDACMLEHVAILVVGVVC